MSREKKKTLAMTIALGVLLAALAGALLPAAAASPARFKAVEASVKAVHEGEGPADPSWVEYWYEVGVPTYIVRFEEPVGSLRAGDTVTLYANIKRPETVRKDKPSVSGMEQLAWVTLIPVGLLFAGSLAKYILAFRKEKQHADT